jgi:hypothetical protein
MIRTCLENRYPPRTIGERMGTVARGYRRILESPEATPEDKLHAQNHIKWAENQAMILSDPNQKILSVNHPPYRPDVINHDDWNGTNILLRLYPSLIQDIAQGKEMMQPFSAHAQSLAQSVDATSEAAAKRRR